MKVFCLFYAFLLITNVNCFWSLFESSYNECLKSYSSFTWNSQAYCDSGKQLLDVADVIDFDAPSSLKFGAMSNSYSRKCYTGELLFQIGKVKQMLLMFECNSSRINFSSEITLVNNAEVFVFVLQCSNENNDTIKVKKNYKCPQTPFTATTTPIIPPRVNTFTKFSFTVSSTNLKNQTDQNNDNKFRCKLCEKFNNGKRDRAEKHESEDQLKGKNEKIDKLDRQDRDCKREKCEKKSSEKKLDKIARQQENKNDIQWHGDWAVECEFPGNNIKPVVSLAELCGQICFDTAGCTHFSWSSYRSICWLKSGEVSRENAVPKQGSKCGIVIQSKNNVLPMTVDNV